MLEFPHLINEFCVFGVSPECNLDFSSPEKQVCPATLLFSSNPKSVMASAGQFVFPFGVENRCIDIEAERERVDKSLMKSYSRRNSFLFTVKSETNFKRSPDHSVE
jgi:hypothetical protein